MIIDLSFNAQQCLINELMNCTLRFKNMILEFIYTYYKFYCMNTMHSCDIDF